MTPSKRPTPVPVSPTISPANSCQNDISYTFKLRNGKIKDCSWIVKNFLNLDNRRRNYCFEDDGVTITATGYACQSSCDICGATKSPAGSPITTSPVASPTTASPVTSPTTASPVAPPTTLAPVIAVPTTTQPVLPTCNLAQVVVNLDSSVLDNRVVIKKKVGTKFLEVVAVKKRNEFTTANGQYTVSSCLDDTECYKFIIRDSKQDGFTNGSGSYTLRWKGNVLRTSYFNGKNLQKETKQFGNNCY